MTSKLKNIVMLALVMPVLFGPLAACGFRPLYGDNGAATSSALSLSTITVEGPDSSVGRRLKFDVLDLFNNGGEQPVSAAYRLSLLPTSYSQNVAVQQDASVTRANFVLVVPFVLISTKTGKVVFRSTSRARSSYNRADSEFANLSASNDAEKRTAESVADDIKTQLSVYFDRQQRQDEKHQEQNSAK
ncbi:MAG: LPS assembly lipoprotein LptE [Parvibaculaceae bacterium]